MSIPWLMLLVLTVSLCSSIDQPSSLRLVQLIYRHGDRIPVYSFPTDPHRSSWPSGTDQLTQIGMKQLFELGKYLRRRYSNFIPHNFDPTHVYVRSTSYQRTVKSAYCKLAGLYSYNDSATIEEELPRMLSRNMTIVTSPPNKDLLMRIRSICPAYERLWMDKQKSHEWMVLETYNKNFFKMIERHTGLKNVSLMEAFSVADPVSCWIAHNKTFPYWMTQPMADQLLLIGSLKHYLKFSTPAMQRLRGGPLVKRMIRNIERKINNSGIPQPLMYSYSAHDGTISAVMNYLGIFNMQKSPYGTCFILELHDMPSYGSPHDYVVKVYLRNSTSKHPYQLRIPNCELNCRFSKFKSLVSWNLPQDIRKECFPTGYL